MFDAKAYEDARERLLGDLLRTVGHLAMNLPAKPTDEFALMQQSGYYRDSAQLHALADLVRNIQHSLDMVCYAAGAKDNGVPFDNPKPS